MVVAAYTKSLSNISFCSTHEFLFKGLILMIGTLNCYDSYVNGEFP